MRRSTATSARNSTFRRRVSKPYRGLSGSIQRTKDDRGSPRNWSTSTTAFSAEDAPAKPSPIAADPSPHCGGRERELMMKRLCLVLSVCATALRGLHAAELPAIDDATRQQAEAER